MPSEYELERQRNIERNKKILADLGLDKPFFEPKEKRRPPKSVQKKRKATADQNDSDDAPPVKITRKTSSEDLATGLRRSQRNAGRAIDYNAEKEPASQKNLTRTRSLPENAGDLGRSSGKRLHNPKTFGSIPGIAVGTWWESREDCSRDAIHAPWVAGIAPSKDGAYSVALSGGYDDDVDEGYAFTYTGSGGRDLKGTKAAPKNLRTAPQSSDQTFDNNFNYSLKRSAETKKPVRVIRGFKLKSKYAPSEGYRFDGLYIVEKAWQEKGLNKEGYKVCKFAFKRIAGQPPLPVRYTEDGSESDAEDNLESED